MKSKTLRLPASTTEEELLRHVDLLNADDAVDGILIQLPVPAHINERRVCNAVAPRKDVDGFHVANIGRLCVDQRALVSATPAAVLEIIKRTGSCRIIFYMHCHIFFVIGHFYFTCNAWFKMLMSGVLYGKITIHKKVMPFPSNWHQSTIL